VALGVPDPAAGERVRLVAALAPGQSAEAAEAGLRAHFRAQAPAYMMPADIRFLESLPLSPNGKIDRAALRAAHGA